MTPDKEHDYALLDSGEGEKLERFGSVTLVRPSSQALWKKRLGSPEWERAQARFDPDRGWRGEMKVNDEWEISALGLRLLLRLQQNGQIGFFPEHMSYVEDIHTHLVQAQGERKVLNLFGFTGLASLAAARAGADVTHVDVLKRAHEWAKANLERTSAHAEVPGSIRWITDDAIEFIAREVRRGSRYAIVIADPPSFSRPSKGASWDLENVARELTANIAEILAPGGLAILASHHPAVAADAFANLLHDADRERAWRFERRQMVLEEHGSPRRLPAGEVVVARG